MKKSLLQYIVCPECHKAFHLKDETYERDEVASGYLVCSQCKHPYPIIDGLPIILGNVDRMGITKESFGRQWTLRAQGVFEKDTIYGLTAEEELQDFKLFFGLSGWDELSGKFILDAGCGYGRLTKNVGIKAPHSTVVGFDISDGARIAFKQSRELSNVHILQGDLLAPPFSEKSFDYVWSSGVMHHTPSSERAFDRLDSLLKSNGKIYIWVYPASFRFTPFGLIRDILWKSYKIPPRLLYPLCWLLSVPVAPLWHVRTVIVEAVIDYVMYTGDALAKFFRIKGAPANYLAIEASKRKVRRKKRWLGLRFHAFGWYDCLSPEFQHRHSRGEIKGWFDSRNYKDVKFFGSIGAVGRKGGT